MTNSLRIGISYWLLDRDMSLSTNELREPETRSTPGRARPKTKAALEFFRRVGSRRAATAPKAARTTKPKTPDRDRVIKSVAVRSRMEKIRNISTDFLSLDHRDKEIEMPTRRTAAKVFGLVKSPILYTSGIGPCGVSRAVWALAKAAWFHR